MKAFRTDKECHVHVFPITITMGESAQFRAVIFSASGAYDKYFNLEGSDYTNWGADDEYIKNWICDKEPHIGRPVQDA